MYKKIFLKLSVLSLPFLLWILWQKSLPLNQYTFRSWEALITSKSFMDRQPFYPNEHLEMTEFGDLAPYTPNSVPKQTVWDTDHFGYRNHAPCDDPQVSVVGDSMAVGTSLTQSDIFSEQLSRELKICVRSFAGGKLNEQLNFIYLHKFHPKWIVMIIAEKYANWLGEADAFTHSNPPDFSFQVLNPLYIGWMHFRKNLYWNYRAAHGIFNSIDRSLKSPSEAMKPLPSNPKMLYSNEINPVEKISSEEIQHLIHQLDDLAMFLEQKGTHLIVSFVPNKESIYYSEIGVSEPTFGKRFVTELKSPHFEYLDLIQKFKSSYQNDHEYLHQLDDTHWNAKGVHLLAEDTAKIILGLPREQ